MHPNEFDQAKKWVWPRDPIILDLDANGLETVGLASNVYFDHDGDGVLTKTGWAGKSDALLVWDRNANSTIDTGAELFGDLTPLPNGTLAPNGFAALAALDANGDGILDASDPAFTELKLWRDTSQDGQTGAGELISLADAGIVSLNLANTLKNQSLANGNQLTREGSFTRADGTTSAMGEFKLATSTFDTRFAEPVDVPAALQTLPTLDGTGNVRELQQAAAQSGAVAGVLSQFQNATTRAEQKALLDQLLTSWAATSGMAKSLEERAAGNYRIQYEAFGNERRSSSIDTAAFAAMSSGSVGGRGGGTALMTDFGGLYLSEHYRNLISEWGRKLHVLEAFNGQYFFNLPEKKSQTDGANWGLAISAGSGGGSGSGAIAIEAFPTLRVNFSQAQLDLLQQAYDSLKESVYASLVMQTRLKPYLDQIELIIDDSGLRLDATQLNQILAAKKNIDPENYLADLLDLDRYANGFLSGTNWQGLAGFDALNETLPQTAGITVLLNEFKVRTLTRGDDNAYLMDKADIVLTGDGKDTLYGYNGNDRLFGQGGDDRIYGGSGDDLISGGAGIDVLEGESGADTYVFGRGYGHDTVSDHAENGVQRDTVRLLGLNPADIRVSADDADNLVFTIIDTDETLSVPRRGYGWGQNGIGQYVFDDGTVWSHDDALRATVAASTENDDVIHGSSAGDAITGQAGNDTLIGNGGNDVIDGGAGNDLLIGSTGWNWIYENGSYRVERTTTPSISANGNDTYLFGRGDGQDTVIDGDYTTGNSDTLRFKEGVAPADVKFIRSGNDLVLAIRGSSDRVTLKQYFDETWKGANGPYLIERVAFADGTVLSYTNVQAILFTGSEEAETIIGSRAADGLTGQGGEDVLLGGAGRDILDGGAGNDVLRGGGVIGWGNQVHDGSGEGDAYRFGRGDGHDTIIEDSWTAGEVDRIELKAGVLPADVRLGRVRTVSGWQVSEDLKITLRDTGETLIVKNHFNESNRYAVEEVAFADGTLWDAETIKSLSLLGEAGNDELRGFNERGDLIEGGAGNDKLVGLSGNDALAGGAGDDVLEGGMGSDIYRFGLGDGQDVINEGYNAGTDTVELAAGVAPLEVTVRWTLQGDMAVTLPDGSKLTVRGQADTWSTEGGVEQLRFADGMVWDRSELASRALAATAGDDAIVGGYQDDTLDGGTGNDRFQSLGGYDTYRFGVGDGQDLIEATYGRVLFKPGIGQNDVAFTRDGNDLSATVAASGDAVRIKDWLDSWQRIDRFDFHNGARLSVNDVLTKLNVSEGAEILYGSPGEDALAGTEKGSTLHGREGNDVLTGGAGSDQLYGEAGDDTLDGGADRDSLYGGAGNNRYRVAEGMGLDTVLAASFKVADDTVVFAPAIRPSDVSVQLGEKRLSGEAGDVGYYNLVIGIGGNDALIVSTQDYDDLGRGALRHFRFHDGTQWTLSDVIAHADGGKMGRQQRYRGYSTDVVGSQADDEIIDSTGQSVTVRSRGNDDRVYLQAGNDRISAGSGNDNIFPGSGGDLVAGEAGDDNLDTGAGDDVVVFNVGDGDDTLCTGENTDTLSFGSSVTPTMLSAALDRTGRVVLLVEAGTGGSVTLDNTRVNHLPGDLERIQFIDAEGKARVFDLASWLQANAGMLLSATAERPLAFDGTGFELTSAVAPAGGLEVVAYALSGELFAPASVANGTPSEGDDLLYGTHNVDMLDAGGGNDMALGLAGDDAIFGGDGDDLIYGGEGNDVLEGDEGSDVIYGGFGADQLTGGIGQDQLFGEFGGDTYVFQSGHGEVIIDDNHRVLNWSRGVIWDGGEGGFGGNWNSGILIDNAPNILQFGPGIHPEDLRYSEQNGDLVIQFFNQPGDRVILRGYEPNRPTQTRSVDIIRFADGAEIVAETIDPMAKTEVADTEGGWLYDTPFADTLIGSNGTDTLNSQGGADRLVGGTGSDIYRIHKAWGTRPTEVLIAETWREQDSNLIVITGEIHADDLRLEFEGSDLLVRLTEAGDAIRFAGFDPRAEGMRAPVSGISLPWRGVSLSFADLLARGVRIIGTPNEDVLAGTALADWIEAREDNDTMSGGAGGDLYLIDANEGIDTIIDTENGDAQNTLVLPEGMTLSDVRLSFDQEGFLILNLDNTGNRVRLSGFEPQNPLGSRAVERFRFGIDGDEISYEELLGHGFDIVGTEEIDALNGTALTDRIRGGEGNDLIEATPGDDTLAGEGGNDSYLVKLGDGIVTIDDVAEQGAGNVLRFGPGIDPNVLRNNLRFEVDGNGGHALLVRYGDEGDVVRLSGFNPRDVLGNHAIQRFEFADGTAVDYSTLISWTFVVEGDNAGNALEGTNVGDRLYGYDGEDVMESADGEDVLSGGLGNDVLRGGARRDAYAVNRGDGKDLIEDDLDAGIGNVLTFGEGISRHDVQLKLEGNDLLVYYGANADMVRVTDYAPDGASGGTVVDTFEFVDGTAVTLREFMNRDPRVANAIDDQEVFEDAAFSLVLPDDLFIDADGDEVLIRVTVSGYTTPPDWLQYDTSTRTLFGGPGNDDVGELDVIVQGMDKLGATSLHSFHVTVQNTNDAPGLGTPLSSLRAVEGGSLSFVLPADSFFDVDVGDVLTYTATLANSDPLPAWLTFDAQTSTFSGTPANGDAGEVQLTVTATDRAGAAASQSFTLTVASGIGNRAPVTTADVTNVIEDRKPHTSGNVLANDRDWEGERLRVADPGIRRGDYGTLFLLSDGNFAYMLDDCSAKVQGLGAGQAVTDTFNYLASDGGQRSNGTLTVTVQGTNDTPDLARGLADMRLAKGKAFSRQIPAGSFRDADRSDRLTYTATLSNGKALPTWLRFDAATQTFSGTAPAHAKGSVDVRVTASDGHGECSTAMDDFKVSFGSKTVEPTITNYNERQRNGPDAPSHGYGSNVNDGAGNSPGKSGRKQGADRDDDPLSRFLDGFKRNDKSAQSTLPVLDRRSLDPSGESSRACGQAGQGQVNHDVERHWAELTHALNRLDAERQSAPARGHINHGADLAGLAGWMQAGAYGAYGGVDAVSLACGTGTRLKGFSGIKEGIGKLSC